MQLSSETVAKYEREAPELFAAVTSIDSGFIMARDTTTDACVKFDQGLCAIHRDYGDAFLGDACNFFPRITRALGTGLVTSATLSCPEAARLMLYDEDGFELTPREEVRVPYSLRNYLPTEISQEEAFATHDAFMRLAGANDVSAEWSLMRVSTVARALELQPVSMWGQATPLYISMADGRIPAAEVAVTDPFHLVHALYGLVMASPSRRKRLMEILEAMQALVGVRFDSGGALTLVSDAPERVLKAMATIQQQSAALESVWRRYLQAQLSQALFPFAGFGGTLSERVTIIGVRFATMRLAVAMLGEEPKPEAIINTIQVLSRFMDHLADPTLSLQIYRETGWIRESRMRALLAA